VVSEIIHVRADSQDLFHLFLLLTFCHFVADVVLIAAEMRHLLQHYEDMQVYLHERLQAR